MNLPTLSDEPKHYAGCCLSLSTGVIDSLYDVLLSNIKSGLTLSIGSGTGLLEALLNDKISKTSDPSIVIEGVEVRTESQLLNLYLPKELTNTVDGTWAVCHRMEIASALMFVYPRSIWLVKDYLRKCVEEDNFVKVLVWLGPKADWEEFDPVFQASNYHSRRVISDCGLAQYEMMAVLKLNKL